MGLMWALKVPATNRVDSWKGSGGLAEALFKLEGLTLQGQMFGLSFTICVWSFETNTGLLVPAEKVTVRLTCLG